MPLQSQEAKRCLTRNCSRNHRSTRTALRCSHPKASRRARGSGEYALVQSRNLGFYTARFDIDLFETLEQAEARMSEVDAANERPNRHPDDYVSFWLVHV
jgi:hypothetical protein